MLRIYESHASLDEYLKSWGFTVLHRALTEAQTQKLLNDVRKYPLRQSQKHLYDNNILQDFDYYDGKISEYLKGFIDGLQVELNLMFRASCDQEIIFDDVIIQRYTEGHQGIDIHRDPKNCQGIVVNICLSGEADFSVYYDSHQNTHTVPVGARAVSILGAAGFHGRSYTKRHSVHSIKGERYVIGLRQMAA